MTDRQLQYILAIAEEGSLTAAAEKLFISQPSLSALLAKVENDFGAKFFERNILPVKLTYAGECYLQAARQILSIQKELRDKIFDIQNEEAGKMIVGCSPLLSTYLFSLIVPAFMRRYPNIELNLLEDYVMFLNKLLIADNLDLLFTTVPIYNDTLIQTIPLYTEEILLFAPAAPPHAALGFGAYKLTANHDFPACDMSRLNKEPFVLFKKGRYLRHITDRIFEDSKIAPRIILETNDWETCLSMVEKGLACTLLPDSWFKQISPASNINRYSIKNKPLLTTSLCYKKRASLSKNIERFISLSKELINNFINLEKTGISSPPVV
jgi:DNA-binding transcriptional LysR family regulator